jgi:hypothetical protein
MVGALGAGVDLATTGNAASRQEYVAKRKSQPNKAARL